MIAGQNLPAPHGPLSVRLEDSSNVAAPHLCALLLRSDSKVRADDDFVFFNQPTHASGSVSLDVSDGPSPRLVVDLERVPADVERVAVAVASDDVLGNHLLIRVEAGGGGTLDFKPTELHRARAAVLLEIYRRHGTWKVRAVGQGWASGLAGLAIDHGVRVDEDTGDEEAVASTPSLAPVTAVSSSERNELALEVGRLREQRLTITRELAALNRRVREARAVLVETDERALLQEVGYFEYRHPLENSLSYKERLDVLRARIKGAVRDRTAVTTRPGWMVNGSAKEGAALTRDFSTLMLRAYNAEADNCLRTVRPHTVAAVTQRLVKTREAIAKSGAVMGITIDETYHGLRVAEVSLVAEYQARLELEREELREARQREREEAKALADLEREQARLLTERFHHEAALARLRALGDAAGVAELEGKLAAVDAGLRGIHERQANTRVGHVYVISNPGAFGESVVKIGVTRRLDPLERVRELSSASVPFGFDVHALIFSQDAYALEAALHGVFTERRVNRVNMRREFFFVSPGEVREVLGRVGRDHVVQWTDTAEAIEWRQSRADQDRADVRPAQRERVNVAIPGRRR
ncbi:MAG: DUF4041 domain-containing protein [Nocardioidaceae bacterium]